MRAHILPSPSPPQPPLRPPPGPAPLIHDLTAWAAHRPITTSPDVEPAGAAQFWATAYGSLHRGGWRRVLRGVPHLAYEYRWHGRQLTITLWRPGSVPARPLAGCGAGGLAGRHGHRGAGQRPDPGRYRHGRGPRRSTRR